MGRRRVGEGTHSGEGVGIAYCSRVVQSENSVTGCKVSTVPCNFLALRRSNFVGGDHLIRERELKVAPMMAARATTLPIQCGWTAGYDVGG